VSYIAVVAIATDGVYSVVVVSVGLSVCFSVRQFTGHDREPCKNG